MIWLTDFSMFSKRIQEVMIQAFNQMLIYQNKHKLFSAIKKEYLRYFLLVNQIRQIIANLIQLSLKYTSQGQIKLDIKLFNAQCLIVNIREYGIAKDENIKNQIGLQIKQIVNVLKSKRQSYRELDMANNLEIQISAILAYQLSGSIKRGLEFSTDRNGCSTFTFYIENSNSESKQLLNSANDIGPIKVLGQQKYFETSLSLLLAQAQDSSNLKSNQYDDDKLFSVSNLSKQFSIKPSEIPVDLQSAYFSQISKIRQDSYSKALVNSNSQYKQLSNQASFTADQILQTQLKPKSNQKNSSGGDNSNNNNFDSLPGLSALDFGESSLNPNTPPLFYPRFLGSVIKFKLTNSCCSKVLLIDNDYFSQITLNLFLQKYGIKADRAFNGKQALEMISNKLQNKCRCGNSNYLIFFMEINLPFMSGLELIKIIKEMIRSEVIDKGFAIANTSYVDLNTKLECFRTGMDYFLGKPFDLIELAAIISYISG